MLEKFNIHFRNGIENEKIGDTETKKTTGFFCIYYKAEWNAIFCQEHVTAPDCVAWYDITDSPK